MPAPDYAAEIQRLEGGLASGEVTIEANGERVTYRGVKDIKEAISYFRGQAAQATAGAAASGRARFSLVRFGCD